MTVHISPESLDVIEKRARTGVGTPGELVRVIAYARDLIRRNENLGRAERISDNTASRLGEAAVQIKLLAEQFKAGAIAPDKFADGVRYWAEN